jgi:uncharacterized protein involved in response to NO
VRFSTHPFWQAAFRPFFLLTALAGTILPPLWALLFSGTLQLPQTAPPAMVWHAHEMFYGFGWALLAGFLLTASKNWVGIRGYHGNRLALLALAWLLERGTVLFGTNWPPALRLVALNAFLVAAILMVLGTLWRHRARDSFPDNALFFLFLPLFPLARWQLLDGDFTLGAGMSLALFRVAFLIMLERTLTQFIKGAFQTEIRRQPKLDMAIKLTAIALAGNFWLPAWLTAGFSLALAAALLIRLAGWKPWLACRRIDLGIMVAGYLLIVVQLIISATDLLLQPAWTGSLGTHLFTFGVIGCIAPAMILRISKGHTGRKVIFDNRDRALLWLMLAALVVRTVVPQLAPAHYLLWINLSAMVWSLTFATIIGRYATFLWHPRIDGREH